MSSHGQRGDNDEVSEECLEAAHGYQSLAGFLGAVVGPCMS
jgi:hypothetical protein